MGGPVLIVADSTDRANLILNNVQSAFIDVRLAGNKAEAFEIISSSQGEITFCILDAACISAHGLMQELRIGFGGLKIISFIGSNSEDEALESLRFGASTYIMANDHSSVVTAIISNLRSEAGYRNGVRSDRSTGGIALAGVSGRFENLIDRAKTLAAVKAHVLLTGEPGTGKRSFAKFIHQFSADSSMGFIELDCAALEAQVIESVLLNNIGSHERPFVQRTGTALLSNIDVLDTKVQLRLVELLKQRDMTTSGSLQQRLIVSTSRGLDECLNRGYIAEPLYSEFAENVITLSPLRERPEDISLLTELFVRILKYELNKPGLYYTEQFIDLVEKYAWRGNVRELRNAVERACILADGNQALSVAALPADLKKLSGQALFDMQALEKAHIAKVLNYTGGNKVEAARLLGIGLTTLHRKITEYGIIS